MTQNEVLKKIIQDKGWLSIREILFDNAVTVRPLIVDGLITMDADNVYWVASTSPSEGESYNKFVLCGQMDGLSYFNQLRIKGLDNIQGFDVVINTSIHDLRTDPEDIKIHNYNAVQTYKNVLIGNAQPTLKSYFEILNGTEVLADDELLDNGHVYKYENVEAIDTQDRKFMPKSVFDTFNDNRLKFRTYMASLLGVNISTLL